eukprot:4245601-Prymnesium_polylepis.1
MRTRPSGFRMRRAALTPHAQQACGRRQAAGTLRVDGSRHRRRDGLEVGAHLRRQCATITHQQPTAFRA